MEIKTQTSQINISPETRRKLAVAKYQLDCKTYDELFLKVLNLVSQIKTADKVKENSK